ncbi:MAG: CO dehydrogenase/acetyl-CoA synthase subunit delta [bacterium]
MAVEILKERWVGEVFQVKLGAGPDEGGTRTKVITVGGETAMPFHHFEGNTPNPPAIAMEVLDSPPADWPPELVEPYKDVLNDPASWAKKCVEEYGADMICLHLVGAHPDARNSSPEEAGRAVEAVLKAVGVPLIIWGCEHNEKDNEILPRCSEVAKGENCLMGVALQENYKTLSAACLADGHNIITQSPIDINIAKQVNILVSEMGVPLSKIVMHPTTAALGYGLEYVYSIMERTRLAALSGDKMMSMPIICMVGAEAWRVKEAKAPESEQPAWGPLSKRGPMWEITTATSMLISGADILVMRHPESVAGVRKTIEKLMRTDGG